MTQKIYRNDDIGSFGGKIVVTLENPNEYVITRAEFQCGCYYADIKNPVFPLEFKPSREYTKKFNNNEPCYLRVYDENGLRETCEGTLMLQTQKEVVHGEQLHC